MEKLSPVRYSHCMTITMTAPDITPGYPSKGSKIGPAWQEAWDAMVQLGERPVDGSALAKEVAPRHDLAPATLQAILSRAGKAGLLDVLHKMVETTVTRTVGEELKVVAGRRQRSHYRISADYVPGT
jgi:hypothetical protein